MPPLLHHIRAAAAARLLLCLSPFAIMTDATAQIAQQKAVPVNATAVSDPPTLLFTWPADATATAYEVRRRLLGSNAWDATVVVPGGGAATSWVDTTVDVGVAYEYGFTKYGAPTGTGYIAAGIEVPAVHDRGTVALFVAAAMAPLLGERLDRLRQDLVGDGWRVALHEVPAGTSVASMRFLVLAESIAAPNGLEAVFLLGDLPVPYSGNIVPDGHDPDHRGAWPADLYFGEVDGAWTDTIEQVAVADRSANHNLVGDGKYDQSKLPSDVDFGVGRVDLSDLPTFALGEAELLRSYLDKHHAYRHGLLTFAQRAVVDDNFGPFGDYIASTAWRNLGTLLGPQNVTADDFFTALNAPGDGYLWAYGCGAGSYTSSAGVGSTADFAASDNRNIFTVLFGSYYADWDSTDNFLRAPLASGSTLASVWSGRPHWSFHPMGLGETIGYCARMSQNSLELAGSLLYARMVHAALMGDPTLRMHVFASPSDLVVSDAWPEAVLSWTASTDAVDGYHVYRSDSPDGPFTRLTTDPVTGTTFVDTSALAGPSTYMVRALRLETTTSGTFWNLSQGAFATTFLPDVPASHEPFGVGCYTISDSLYRAFETPAAAAPALTGAALTFTPETTANAGDGYRVEASFATFVPPTAAATALPLAGDAQVAVPLTTPFPHPASGSTSAAAELHVHENGVVGLAALTTIDAAPTVAALLDEPAAAFYAWHDFTTDEPGSGDVLFEENGGVAYVTWSGVESLPATSANPTTLQFQFELLTGVVRVVWIDVAAVGDGAAGDAHVIGWSPAGASVDGGALASFADLPQVVGAANQRALSLSASPPPVSTSTDGTMVVYTMHDLPEATPGSGAYLGVTVVGFAPLPSGLDLTGASMPGCQLYLLDTVEFLLATGATKDLTTQLWIPPGVPVNAEFAATAIGLFVPLTLPNGENARGFVSGNGVKSFVNDH